MLILATGGTWDKDYDPVLGALTFSGSRLPAMIAQARLTCAHRLEILMQKDSLDMTTADRMQILEACRMASETQIVIIHGTDTMTDTAVFLHQADLDKTLVLTGAMRPQALGQSDALFNLGHAIAAAQCLPSGCYLSMQGELFSATGAFKDRSRGLFRHTP